MFKLDLEKEEEPEINCQHVWIIEKAREFQKNIYLSPWLTKLKPLCESQQTGKFLKREEYQTTLPDSWEICMLVKKQQLEPDMEQWTGSKLEKGVCQGCILSLCLFTYFCRVHYAKCQAGWSTSWNQDCRRNINSLRYANDTSLLAESQEELKSLLMKVKEESEKAGLKLNIKN